MNNAVLYKKTRRYVLFAAITVFALFLPFICHGAEYSMTVNVSPNIINIESQRLGEIRIFTDIRYSAYIADGDSIFIYFNDGEDSVENIRATRDSWGNLILKFDLEDLLNVKGSLILDGSNEVMVVLVMENGDEYSGDSDVYIADKKAP
jgi:hypothetical protein